MRGSKGEATVYLSLKSWPVVTAEYVVDAHFEKAPARISVRAIRRDRFGPKMRDQVVASTSSFGANMAEAQSAQSRADFISKMEIALKEARETDYWLTVRYRLTNRPTDPQKVLLQECSEITAMLVASVKTAKANGTLKVEVTAQR